jgi:hypothetical protein
MAKKIDVWTHNFAADKKLAERVMAVIQPKIKGVRDDRQELEEEWMRYFNMWNVKHDDSHLYNGNSKLYIPEVRKAVEAQARQLVDLAFPNDDFLDCIPGAAGTRSGAEIQKSLRHYQIMQAKLPIEFLIFARQMCMLGTSPSYTFWDKQMEMAFASARNPKTGKIQVTKKLVELYNGPKFCTRDLFKWYPLNPKKRDHNEDGCVEFRAVDREYLDRAEKAGSLFGKDEIFAGMDNAEREDEFEKDIRRAEEMGLRIDSDQGYAGTASLSEKDEGKMGTFKCATTFLKVVCPEAALPDEDPNKPIPMMIQIYNDRHAGCIRRNPFWHQKTPYQVGRYIYPNADEFYGQGIPKASQFQQYELNSKAEQSMDSVTLALNPIAMIDPAHAAQNADFEVEPGAIWWVSPQQARLASMPDVSGTGYQAIAQMRAQIQDFSDRTPSMPSQFQGKSRTATQSEFVNNALSIDFKTFQRQNESDVLEPVMEMWESLTDQYADEDQIILLLGRNSSDWKRMSVSRSMYLGNYKYFWKVANDMGNKAIKARQLIDAMKVVGSLPPEAQAKLQFNFAECTRVLLKDVIGIPDADRIVPDQFSEPKQDPEVVYRMIRLGMEVECLPSDDDRLFMQFFAARANEEKNEGVKTELIRQIFLHEQQLKKKIETAKAQQAAQMQQMQMLQLAAQAKGGKGSGTQGSGNRSQLSPNASVGDQASGIRP